MTEKNLEPITVFEIKIARTIEANGEQGFKMETPEKFSFIEGMGLLEAAKWHLGQEMTRRYGG
jgi:hypothetical protein